MSRKITLAVMFLLFAVALPAPGTEGAEERPAAVPIAGAEAGTPPKEREEYFRELVERGDPAEIVALARKPGINVDYNFYIRALLSLEREKYVPALIDIVKFSHDSSRGKALIALSRLREPALLDYCKSLLDEKPLTEEETKAIEAEIEKLSSEDEAVRAAAMDEIIKCGPRAKALLQPYLNVNDQTQRELAERLYYGLPDNDPASLLSMTWEYEAKDKVAFAEAVFALKDAAAEGLGGALAILATMKPLDYKDFCIELVKLQSRPSPFSKVDSTLVCSAIKLLGNCGDPAVAEILYPYLEANKRELCAVAALALLKLGDKTQIDKMKEICRKDTSSICGFSAGEAKLFSRGMVALVLLKMGDRTVIDGFFASEKENVELGAMRIAAEARDKESLPKILDIFKNTDNSVHACDALGAISEIGMDIDADTMKMIKEKVALWKESDIDAYYRGRGILIAMGDEESLKEVEQDFEKAAVEMKMTILFRISDYPSPALLPVYIMALDDKTEARFLESGHSRGGFMPSNIRMSGTIGQLAAREIVRITGQPFDLWDLDADRQAAEVKAWWEKQQKTEPKAGD